jgi:hypothetical protein
MTRLLKNDLNAVFGTWKILAQGMTPATKRNIECIVCGHVDCKFVTNLKYGKPPACSACGSDLKKDAPDPRLAAVIILCLTPEPAIVPYGSDTDEMVKRMDLHTLTRVAQDVDYTAMYFMHTLGHVAGEYLPQEFKARLTLSARRYVPASPTAAPVPPIIVHQPSAPAKAPELPRAVIEPAKPGAEYTYQAGMLWDPNEPALTAAQADEANRLGHLPSCIPEQRQQGPTMPWPTGAVGYLIHTRAHGYFYPMEDERGRPVINNETMDKNFLKETDREPGDNAMGKAIALMESGKLEIRRPVHAGNGWMHIYWVDHTPKDEDFDVVPFTLDDGIFGLDMPAPQRGSQPIGVRQPEQE